ncbi:MAG: sulfur carrier protein ThiS [Peptostreptococcaceae bacterium]|nr:sulfur carrier protein ThiS [Peptostreptococcaceae bacterium]
MKVNGREIRLEKSLSLAEFLREEGYCEGRLAVERNGEIVRKADFGSTLLKDGDILEIVNFVGGG